ncbi:MAG: IgA Peptidase M64 [candidate division KSB1 bacterium]|nr:IgA Peptidase M64 [candidate division KSB1 bacterium]
MKIFVVLFALSGIVVAGENEFFHWFEDKTLRVDYVHCGDGREEEIGLAALIEEGAWPGRTARLTETLDLGQYCVQVYDQESGQLLYAHGFCSVFGEWQTTEEALNGLRRAMHESVRIPFPRRPVRLELLKRNRRNEFMPLWSLTIDPASTDIRRELPVAGRVRNLIINGDPKHKVDLVILGDGYRRNETAKLRRDAHRFVDVLFSVQPFKERRSDFNVRLIETPSQDSGIDDPRSGVWKRTTLGCRYNTFNVQRYVLCPDNQALLDIAAAAPYDAIYVLINSSQYGGGGIFNQFAVCYAGGKTKEPEWWAEYVFVHEFGHSFAGLADEYYNSEVAYNDLYPLDVEPLEPNITTLNNDGSCKWRNLLSPNVPVPTPWNKSAFDSLARLPVREKDPKRRAELQEQLDAILNDPNLTGVVGCFEGAGYASTGIYRPALNCRMFSKSQTDFCPVCRQAILQMIDLTCGR